MLLLPSVRGMRPQVYVPLLIALGLIPVLVYFALRSAEAQATVPHHVDGVPPTPLVTAEGLGSFVGSETCRECHASQFGDHAGSLHAQTIFEATDPRVASLFETDQVLKDPALGASYTFALEGGKPLIRVRDKSGKTTELEPAFCIGSGKYGVTPLLERDGVYMESRPSHYPNLNGWYWTPGQQDENASRQPEGRMINRDEAIRCYLCHGTAVVQTEKEPIAPGSIPQVGCERCHGPGKEHVEAARRGRKGGGLYTFSRASAGTVTQLCAQCHRHPTDSAAAELENDPNLPRFAGTALAASECYKKSPGKLTCTTCHDPHKPVSTDASSYERVCLSCHTRGEPEQKACPVSPASGCIPCHMPAQSINFPGGAKFHNHWIKPYEKEIAAAFARSRDAERSAAP